MRDIVAGLISPNYITETNLLSICISFTLGRRTSTVRTFGPVDRGGEGAVREKDAREFARRQSRVFDILCLYSRHSRSYALPSQPRTSADTFFAKFICVSCVTRVSSEFPSALYVRLSIAAARHNFCVRWVESRDQHIQMRRRKRRSD